MGCGRLLSFPLISLPMKSPALISARRAFAAAVKVYNLVPYYPRQTKIAAYVNVRAAAVAVAAARK